MKYNGNIDILGTITLNSDTLSEQIEFNKINVMSKPVMTSSDLVPGLVGNETDGLLCFVLDEQRLYYYNSSDGSWKKIETNFNNIVEFKNMDLSTISKTSFIQYNSTTSQFELVNLDINSLNDVNLDSSITEPSFIYWNGSEFVNQSALSQVEITDDNTKTYSTTFVNTLIKRIGMLEDLVLTVIFTDTNYIDINGDTLSLTSSNSVPALKNKIEFDIFVKRNGENFYDESYLKTYLSEITVTPTINNNITYTLNDTINGPFHFIIEFTEPLDWNNIYVITIGDEVITFEYDGTKLQTFNKTNNIELAPIESEFAITKNNNDPDPIDILDGTTVTLDYEINDDKYKDLTNVDLVRLESDPISKINLNPPMNITIDNVNLDTTNKQISFDLNRDDTTKLIELNTNFDIILSADFVVRDAETNECFYISSKETTLTNYYTGDIYFYVNDTYPINLQTVNSVLPTMEIEFSGKWEIFDTVNNDYVTKDDTKIELKSVRTDDTIPILVGNHTRINDTLFKQDINLTNNLIRGEQYKLILNDGLFSYMGYKLFPSSSQEIIFDVYDYSDISYTSSSIVNNSTVSIDDISNVTLTFNHDFGSDIAIGDISLNNDKLVIIDNSTPTNEIIIGGNATINSLTNSQIEINLLLSGVTLENSKSYTIRIKRDFIDVSYDVVFASGTTTKHYNNENDQDIVFNTEANELTHTFLGHTWVPLSSNSYTLPIHDDSSKKGDVTDTPDGYTLFTDTKPTVLDLGYEMNGSTWAINEIPGNTFFFVIGWYDNTGTGVWHINPDNKILKVDYDIEDGTTTSYNFTISDLLYESFKTFAWGNGSPSSLNGERIEIPIKVNPALPDIDSKDYKIGIIKFDRNISKSEAETYINGFSQSELESI